MANDFTAFSSAVYSALGGTASNPAAYYALAPQGSTPPYTIFQRMSASNEYTFTGAGVGADYMVKVISNRQWPGQAQEAYGSVHSTIQNKALNLGTAFTALRCERRTTIEYMDNDRYWHVGGIYRIEAWEV